MPDTQPVFGDAQQCLDAIRLALVGSDNDRTKVIIIEEIIDNHAPEPNPSDTVCVQILVDSISDAGGKFVVPPAAH